MNLPPRLNSAKFVSLMPTDYSIHSDLARHYHVSREGQVYSKADPERPMAQRLTRLKRAAELYTVTLFLKGRRYRAWVHVLVMLTYMPPRGAPFSTSIRHMDENRLNNHVDNLEWWDARQDMPCPCCGVPLSQSPVFNHQLAQTQQ